MRAHFRIKACAKLIACAALVGCISPENLRNRTEKKLASCLATGVSIGFAEKCTLRADLWFDRETPMGVRIYRHNSWGTASVVVKLQFNQESHLESCSSQGEIDGM